MTEKADYMIQRRSLAAVAVAVLLVVAGCSGTSDQSPDATTTATTVGEINPTTTAQESDASQMALPAGVTANGLENASALVTAHNRSLADRSYRFAFESNSSEYSSRIRAARGLDATLLVANSANTTTRSWTQGSRTSMVQTADGERGYRLVQGEYESALGFDTYADLTRAVLVTYLRVGEYETTDVVTRDGTKLVELTATGINRSAVDQLAGEESNVSVDAFEARVLVDSDGVVHEFEATVTETVDAESRTNEVGYDLSDLGSASVERPDWASSIPQLNATITEDGAVAIEHTGGPAVEDGTRLSMATDSVVDGAQLSKLSAGETAYLYVAETADGQRDVRASVGDRPSSDQVALNLSESDRLVISGTSRNVSILLQPEN
ncbi:DUF7537 family lipoprotein [Halorussus halophilus]|uniref:DUF7537 family lipoprotein n=1 Tax=Halorussus halophilus TaxID=2650975 RepID=UPI0013015C98|nr:hypothetical protein [Halorussus halophilus]